MVALAFASYLSMYPLLLLPPLVLLCHDRQSRPSPPAGQPPDGTDDTDGSARGASALVPAAGPTSLARFASSHVLAVALVLAALLLMSYLVTGCSWEFLASTYGVQLTLTDLTPNVGLWWYFFGEMFDPFRSFFLAVFWLHLASYVAGLTIRIRRQPLAVLALLLGIFATFKPYPAIGDTALFLAVVPLYRHVFPLMLYPYLITAVVLYATFLGPAFYHLWIYAGSGTANFFYAITLVWGLGQSLLVCDLTFAILRDEWEVERPEMVGKDIRQI